jgi:tetratricopeptide (TPR) repeat protein
LPSKYGRQLLQQLIGAHDLPPAVEQHLGLRSREGLESPVNPLFLEEAVNVMMGLGVLQVNGRVQVNESLLSQMQIPDTIHGLLLARIDRLPVASRDLLQIASVIGRQFNLEPLVSISPDTSRAVATALLENLAVEEITQMMTADPEWSYLFQHAMTHEVAYESLPFARRQTLHAAVADWLVERYQDNLKPLYAVLAYHYSRANDPDNGLRFALAAADSARDIFANQEAVELYTLAESHLQVLGEEERWETAVHIFLHRCDAFKLLGDFSQAIKDAERVLDHAIRHDDYDSEAKAYNLLAHLKYYQSHFEEALALSNNVIDHPSSRIPHTELAKALLMSGMALASLSEYAAALIQLQKAEAICSSINNNQTLADILNAYAFVYYSQKKLESALKIMQKAVTLSRNFSTLVKIGSTLNNIALIQLNLGLPEEALETLDESAALAEETSQNLFAYAIINKAEAYAYLGKFSQALSNLEKAVSLFTIRNDEIGLVEAYLLLGYEYYPAINDPINAEQALKQAQQLIESRQDSHLEQQVRAFIGLANVDLMIGLFEKAKISLNAAEELAVKGNLIWWVPALRYLQGQAELGLANTVKAKTHFKRGLSSIEGGGCPDYLPSILLKLAIIEENESRQVELLKRCLLAAKQRSRYIDKINCFHEAGQLLANQRDPDLKALGQKYLLETDRLQNSSQIK